MRRVTWFITLILLLSCHKDKRHEDINDSPEVLLYDSVFTTTENDHGFFYFQPLESAGDNWISPYDFYNGQFFYRIEIIDYPSDISFILNLCIWADIEGAWESWKETCCGPVIITGKGSFTTSSVPSTWWVKDVPVDFSRVADFERMGVVLWCNDYQNLSDWISPGNSCWAGRDMILPLTMRLTLVAVANGATFSGWENYE